MSSLKVLGILGTGGLGVLAVGVLGSHLLNTGTQDLFGIALIIFVIAGAVALILRSM